MNKNVKNMEQNTLFRKDTKESKKLNEVDNNKPTVQL